MKLDRLKRFHIVIGPLLYFLCLIFLPQDVFNTLEMRSAIGTITWMAYWWVSSCIDYAITGFLPIAINSIVAMAPMSIVIANYSSETILLLLGASVLTVSWEFVGLDKRIAYTFLTLIGSSLVSQIIFWFGLSVAMSSVMPNSIVCSTITPIAVSMLRYVGVEDIKNNKTASILLLTIAWGAGLGGLASPLGGAMNLVIIDYIEQYTNREFLYVDWVIKFAPIMLILIISNLAFLIFIKPKNANFEGSKEYFAKKNKQLGKMSSSELTCLILFAVAAILSFTRPLYSSLLPGLKPAYIFIICGILSFLIKNPSGEKVMIWGSVQKRIGWELMYVFAGGLAAGTLINESGAAEALSAILSSSTGYNEVVLVLLIISLTIILSDITSNTATAAVAMPIVFSLTLNLELNPIPYVLAASIGINLSYCMPTSIRAIPVGYGLSPSYMFKNGIKLTAIVISLMTLLVVILMRYWPMFSYIQ